MHTMNSSQTKKILYLVSLVFFVLLLFGKTIQADAASSSVKTLAVGKSYTISGYAKVSSSNTTVASSKKQKTDTYKIKAKSKGRATLNLYNSKGRVVKKVYLLATNDKSFQYDTKAITLTKGSSKTVKATVQKGCSVKYSSSNAKVASVDSKGKIKALKKGNATISAKVYYKGKNIKTMKKEVKVKSKTSTKASSNSSNSIKILFVGNSRTYYHDIPNKFKKLAESLGKEVSVNSVTYPNATLKWLSKNRKSQITSQSYDYVIMQEVSEQCINYSTFYSGAKAVTNLVREKNPDVKVILRKMWKRKSDGKKLRDRAYNNTEKIASKLNLTMSYDGPAFELCTKRYSSLNPMQDNSHQSAVGAYLSACCIYKAVFNESPVGASYHSNLSASNAKKLQQIAEEVS